MRQLVRLFVSVVLFICFLTPAFASEPTLVFTSIDSAQDMAVNATQTLTYTVRNNVPTQPQPINKVTLTSKQGSSTSVASTFTNNCNNLVPAGGTCVISVRLNSNQQPGHVNDVLNIYYGSRNIDLTTPIEFEVTGSAPSATLVFVSQPSTPQSLDSGDSTTLAYEIKNTSSVSAVYSPIAQSQGHILVTSITSDACNGTINPNQICEIDVEVIAPSVTSTESDAVDFTVNYGTLHPNVSALEATPVEFTISPASANLSFVQPLPLVPNLTPGETGAPLVFTIANGSGSPIPFTASVSSSDYDSAVINNNCSSSVPANGTCEVSVTLTANSDIDVSTTVYQYLKINYESTKHLIAPLNYTITVTSSPALTFSALPANNTVTLSTNTQPSTPSFVYTITNSSSQAIAFEAITANPETASDSVSFTNTCGGTVPANNGTCDINVYIVTTNTPTSAGSPITHALTVKFGPSYSYTIAQIPTFNVNVNEGPYLIYSLASAPNSQIIGGNSQTLLYKVQNNGGSSVKLSGVSITNSSANTGSSTTSITYAPIPSTDSPCFQNGSFVSLLPGKSCDLNVIISAPRLTAVAGAVTQYLNVTSNTPTITQALIYNVLTSQLSFVAEPEADVMGQSDTQTLIYGLHNSDSTQAVTFDLSHVSFIAYPDSTPVGASLFNTTFTDSCNEIIPANGNCSIRAVITPISTGQVENLALRVANSDDEDLLTSTFPIDFRIISQSIPKRTFTFVNNCPSTTIWIGLNGGASNNVTSTTAPPNPHIAVGTSSICTTNADCPTGATCVTTNTTTATKLCFWNAPSPAGGYALASSASTTLALPEYSQITANDKNTVWSGNIAARTSCSTDGLCQTADCSGASGTVVSGENEPNSTQACFPGIGATPPDAVAEFTLSRTSPDYYDISIINGANVPISMKPTTLTSYQTTQHSNNGYICGEPGDASSTSNGAGAASWAFSAPNSPSGVSSKQYVDVLYAANKPSCTTNSMCSATPGDVCGLTFNPTSNSFNQQCGVFIGYWTGDQICGTNNGAGASPNFNCSTNAGMSAPYSTLTIADLYKCDNGLPSCYNNPNSNNSCCGCANWNDVPSIGALVPAAPLVEACPSYTSNSAWNSNLQINGSGSPNNIAWLKAAVPSAYTYPYDDPSSTFTCPNCTTGAGQPTGGCTVPSDEFNTSDYTITFCPGGSLIPTPS